MTVGQGVRLKLKQTTKIVLVRTVYGVKHSGSAMIKRLKRPKYKQTC